MRGAWVMPEGGFRTGLRVLNSLTRNRDEFLTQSGTRRVNWYMCGPTVYSDSHMGHARTYLGFDIIRRIMSDYFGYQVFLCMNITDIDDKIILTSAKEGKNWLEFAKYYENRFFEDMAALNVKPPDVLTRVSEYTQEIIDYIAKIIERGYAYESNGSVYFDTESFSKVHAYGKLEPNSINDMERITEGEGALTDAYSQEKRRPGDFALWKKSKEGEPAWESPWGPGRPGWHIECSAMASDILPCPMDIHSGGVDLRFPHHDNELAQSEAFFDCDQWVNYFWHTGHLHIDGCKMARSLKNFIVIRNLLGTYSGNQIRMMFLLHKWDGLMDYSPQNSLTEAVQKEKKFNEFFMNANAKLREESISGDQKPIEADKELLNLLMETKDKVHEALCNNFGTDIAINELSKVVNKGNAYIQGTVKKTILQQVLDYVQHILKCFGLEYGKNADESDIQRQILDALVRYRDEVRSKAISKDFQGVLQSCDLVRDSLLPPIGVRLEDVPGEPGKWKLDDPENIMREIQRKQLEEEKKQMEKKKMAEQREKQRAEKEAKAKIPPNELFINQTDKFSQFDERGIPTADAAGEPLSKSLRRKLEKEWSNQEKIHSKFLNDQ